MKQETSKEGKEAFIPPVSVFTGPIAELVGHRLLSPPTRPGLLASLARYEVVRVLGGGGMGVVVLARDAEKGKDVAIKLIRPELVGDQRMVHRFVKEAGHLQKLKHANVVPVLEVSDRAEGPYFVMPYYERGSLASRIRPGQPLESDVILEIARQIAEGLAFAHRHGIIHRDLKPANILLGAGNKSCLADFGLARTMFNDTLIDVEREQLEGTAPYMSPGVAAGNAEDTRCDIYAFGALLYEMLTGEPPYAGRSTSDIRSQILSGPPKPIPARNPAADPGLLTVAEGAMARELRDRYADMADVVADLDRIAAGRTPAGPHGLSNRVKHMPVSPWIPAGVLMMAVGLWLMWPSAPSKVSQPGEKPTRTNGVPRTFVETQQPVTTEPATPKTGPVPTITEQPAWHLSIFAGKPGEAGSADGNAADARFRSPGGIAIDSNGNAYVADTGNNIIRKVTRDGSVTTLAGSPGKPGARDGSGATASFLAPLGIAVDLAGNVYVAEFAADDIRKITPEGIVTTIAGAPGFPGAEDGAGDHAHFRNPWSVAVDSFGDIYVADKDNCTIRQIITTGRVDVFAGRAGKAGYGNGPSSYAKFNQPHWVAMDNSTPKASVYVADTGNKVIRVIKPSGMVSTLAGEAGEAGFTNGRGDKARFQNVSCLAVGEAGNIYAIDGELIRKITPEGDVTTLPDAAIMNASGQTIHPTSLAVDRTGLIYFVEGLNNVIWKSIPPKPQTPPRS